MPKLPLSPASSSEPVAVIDDLILQGLADPRTLNRARAIVRKGRIADATRRGLRVEGSVKDAGATFQVSVLLPRSDSTGTVSLPASCTCFHFGTCDHIVALILAWADDPGQFTELPTVAALLAGKSPDALVAIIERMVERAPDLEHIITLPIPAAATGSSPSVSTLDPLAIEAQVRAALQELLHPPALWGGLLMDNSEGLDELMSLSREYGDAGLWADAQILLTAMAREIIAVSWRSEDDEGYLAEMLFNCDVGLSTCLAIQETLPETDRLDGGQRERLLRSLYDIWRFDTFDIGWGSLATNGPEAIARCVTPAERTRVDGWLAAERLDTPFTQDMTSNFRVLLAEHAGLGAERLLAIYREAGRWNDVANRLFAANQVDNAIAVAREHLREPASLLPFATRLAQQDAPRAVQLVEDLAWEVEGKDAGADAAIEGWLAANLGAAGRAAEALALADKCFALSPTIETWRGVRDVARLPDQETDAWSSRRPRMLSTLREQNNLPTVIVAEVEEGDTDAAELALAEMRRLRERNPYAFPYQEMQMLESIVDQAIEVMHPDKAIARYRHQAELLIGQRKRDAYRQAAQYLERVKLLLDANARRDEWQSIIDEVRNKHKKLSALRDELDALDLA